MSLPFDHDGLGDASHPGPWPAFVDLFAATALIMLVFFAVLAARYVHVVRTSDSLVQTKVASLEKTLQGSAGPDSEFTVTRYGTTVLVVLEEDVSFPRGKARLNEMKAAGRNRLRDIAQLVKSQEYSGLVQEIQVVGHADSVPYHGRAGRPPEHSNWGLSAQRAAAVTEFLVDSMKWDPCRISASGRSDYYPRSASRVAAQPGIDPLASDRRVEILLLAVSTDPSQQRGGCRGATWRP